MRPDQVCAKYRGDSRVPTKDKITVQLLKDDKGETTDLLLIEGEAKALEFLGRVLIAHAKSKKDCEFWFGPHNAGCAFFTKKSTHGFYIHRVPCSTEPGFHLAKP